MEHLKRNFFVLCILFLFFSLPSDVYAQQSETDSLLQLVNSNIEPTEKAEILNKLCLAYCYSNPDTALYFGRKAVEISKQAGSDLYLGKSYNRIGIVKDITSQWDSALYYYNLALELASAQHDSATMASVHNNFGLIYWNQGLLDKAIESFYTTLKIGEEIGLDRMVANAYNNMGLIFWDQQRIDDALEVQHKALKLREVMNDQYGIGASLSNIGMLVDDKGYYDSAIYYYRRSEKIKLALDDKYGLGKLYTNWGITYRNLEEADSSLYYVKKGIEIHLETGNYYNAASSMFNIATEYSIQYQLDSALIYMNKAQALAEEYQYFKLLFKIYQDKGLIYEKRGEAELASECFKKSSMVKDSIFSAERDKAVIEIQKKYETEKMEKQLAVMEKETIENELKLERRKKLLLISGFFILFLVGLGFMLYQRNKSREKAKRDQAIIVEREKGLKAIIKATEDERKRIAKDLHDGIGQQISGLKMFLQQLKFADQDEIRKADKINVIVNELGDDIRNLSHQMMPRALQNLGLVDAIEDMLEKSFYGSSIKYSFEHYNIKERIEEDIEIAVYRISQELINNIIKHSEAKQVNVQLMKRKGFLILIVEDNGLGVDENKEKDGIGMLSIQNRLNIINGDFKFDSEKGKGTMATIRIKLTEN